MTTDAVGGVWTFSTSLARHLAAWGCKVHLVVMGPPPTSAQIQAVRGIDGIEIELTDLELEWLDPAGRDFDRARLQLAAIARRVRPSVVHLNGFREALTDWPAPVLITAHSCVRSWWRACRGCDPDQAEWKIYSAKVSAALTSTAWVAPTRAFHRQISALYTPQTDGRVISNGVEPFAVSREKEGFILAAGRIWDESKNLGALCKVSDSIAWPIRIAGSVAPPGGAADSSACTELEFLGEMSRCSLGEMMSRAAVFISPARYEPFGLAVLEAASAGCALAVADIPTFRELWDDVALFFEPDDIGKMRVALRRICEDSALRASLAGRASRRARLYSSTSTARSYLQAYDSIQKPTQTRAPVRSSTIEARA